jgi:hypothetical protein
VIQLKISQNAGFAVAINFHGYPPNAPLITVALLEKEQLPRQGNGSWTPRPRLSPY